jgi:hypothetical protein
MRIDHDREIGADFLRVAREIDRLVGALVPGVRDRQALAFRFLDDDLDHALALLLRERPVLAHGAGAEHAVDRELVGVVAHVAPQARFVELSFGRERGRDRGPHPAELGARGVLGF